MGSLDIPGPASPSASTPTKALLRGRAWYESLGSPKHIVAPMVDGSEYAWRVLSRRYGATLCYTPMMHAKNFSMSAKARKGFWSSMQTAREEKLIVQFCANEPEVLLQAAKEVEPYADGVDINFGCPQGIAKRGRYGAFLQEEWDVVYNLINILHKNLSIPVTAKIRIFDDRERTLAYAKMVLSAGANILTVHCRTREQKGHQAGLGDWSVLKYLRENLPAETVLFANGNILYYEDIDACLKYTGFDGMMVAETNLHNPGIFTPNCYPRVDEMMKNYLDLLVQLDDDTSWLPVKAHLFRLAKPALMHHIDLRDRLGRVYGKKNMEELWAIHKEIKERTDAEITTDTGEYPLADGYRAIPWYRCQPYYRKPKTVENAVGNAQGEEKESAQKAYVHEVKASEQSLKRSIEAVETLVPEPSRAKRPAEASTAKLIFLGTKTFKSIHSFIKLSMHHAGDPPTEPADLLTWRSYINRAVTRDYGIHGAAMHVDILQQADSWIVIRVLRSDKPKMWDALSGFTDEQAGVGLRVEKVSDFLAGLSEPLLN